MRLDDTPAPTRLPIVPPTATTPAPTRTDRQRPFVNKNFTHSNFVIIRQQEYKGYTGYVNKFRPKNKDVPEDKPTLEVILDQLDKTIFINPDQVFYMDIVLENGNDAQIVKINDDNITVLEHIGTRYSPKTIAVSDIKYTYPGFKFNVPMSRRESPVRESPVYEPESPSREYDTDDESVSEINTDDESVSEVNAEDESLGDVVDDFQNPSFADTQRTGEIEETVRMNALGRSTSTLISGILKSINANPDIIDKSRLVDRITSSFDINELSEIDKRLIIAAMTYIELKEALMTLYLDRDNYIVMLLTVNAPNSFLNPKLLKGSMFYKKTDSVLDTDEMAQKIFKRALKSVYKGTGKKDTESQTVELEIPKERQIKRPIISFKKIKRLVLPKVRPGTDDSMDTDARAETDVGTDVMDTDASGSGSEYVQKIVRNISIQPTLQYADPSDFVRQRKMVMESGKPKRRKESVLKRAKIFIKDLMTSDLPDDEVPIDWGIYKDAVLNKVLEKYKPSPSIVVNINRLPYYLRDIRDNPEEYEKVAKLIMKIFKMISKIDKAEN